jgi:hypothetical protein
MSVFIRGAASWAAVFVVLSIVATGSPAGAAVTVSEPPAAICDDPARLDGPAEPPAGAVVVEPGVSLSQATDESPEGTTFWLAPGVHTLPGGEFDQVVPKSGNTYIGAPGAVLDGERTAKYAFAGDGADVTISYLTVTGFVPPQQEGVVNHDSAPGWTIEHSTIENNDGAGLMGGSNLTVRYSCLRDNGQYGANVYEKNDDQRRVLFHHNEIVGNNTGDWEARIEGCGCSGGVKFWAAVGVVFRDNWVHDNRGVGVWADTNNADFLLEGNLIEDNDSVGFFYEISYNAVVRNNVFRRNVLVDGPEDSFPNGAIYLSESGGDPSAPGRPVIEIVGNLFVDNWNGVTLWENADRFCGSPANTSTGYCPLSASDAQCGEGVIADEPSYSACRWRTQNVTVAHNVFEFDRAAVGCDECGANSIIANYGTWPEWHPYQGDVVQVAITTRQDNRFVANTYRGDWQFIYFDQGSFVTGTEWAAAGQDTTSTMGGELSSGSAPAVPSSPRRYAAVERTYF